MRLNADEMTEEQRLRTRVLWNGQQLENCIALDTFEGWADVVDLTSWDPMLKAAPIHRVYGAIEVVEVRA